MKYALLPLLLSLSACASLHSQVLNNIHQGDSKEHVLTQLGEPKAFETVDDLLYYVYEKRADECAVSFKDEKVVDMACRNDPDYRNPVLTRLGLMLKGMGDGMQRAGHEPAIQIPQQQPSPVNCTTQYNSFTKTASTSCN